MSIDLDTQEKTKVLEITEGMPSILLKNPDNTIDMYINTYSEEASLKVVKDI